MENQSAPASDSSTLVWAQLGLRLLGVMLVVEGLGAMAGGITYGILVARYYTAMGYPAAIEPHSAGWAAGGILQLIGGLYLTTSGRWVLDKVFAPSSPTASIDDDIDDNTSLSNNTADKTSSASDHNTNNE